MKKPILAALGVLLLLALTACGGSSDKPKLDKEETKVARNIAKLFAAQSSGALTAKESRCFANRFVDKVGLPTLKKKKLITADGQLNQSGTTTFDKKTSGQFADAFLACVPYQKRQAEQIAKSDKTVDEKKLEDCLDKEMPISEVRKLIVASQTQSSDTAALVEKSTKTLTACKTKATTTTKK